MRLRNTLLLSIMIVAVSPLNSVMAGGKHHDNDENDRYESSKKSNSAVRVGPRPYFLVEDMDESALKKKLESCGSQKIKKTDFSIGHRGAGMQFPEHSRESYVAAARMGAGIVECDVTFTGDRELVCRHSQCDLHTTTNILATPLAAKCSTPFTAAVIDPNTGETITPASAQCCTSDLTLAEFKSLKAKMDASNPNATTVAEYMNATPSWRTDLYSTKGTLMTHKESIALFKELGVKMTPELKSASVDMPYQGDYTQQDYAQQMINDYKEAGVKPESVFAQSFNLADILYWQKNDPAFGEQAVYLDDRVYEDPSFVASQADMDKLAAQGVNIIAPPMWALVTLDSYGKIVPSNYAMYAKAAGLDIITWTLERSGLLKNGGGWYYQTTTNAINNDGDAMVMLDVLAKDVGVLGVFSDWPATVTYYANCMGIE
ncbi:Glycerophosphoryl diester phosphodiesterase [hydrothermal vent metagenome]|uniref:glycerophosphodiester phosphodiesterase n=1 Tax=hydrothermal vent metagenome TaxID=652676 RepID=A0A3B1BHX8_9ZZZZ